MLPPPACAAAVDDAGQCGHDLCKACLERWRQQQRSQGREQTRCPVCRQPFGSNLGALLLLFLLLLLLLLFLQLLLLLHSTAAILTRARP